MCEYRLPNRPALAVVVDQKIMVTWHINRLVFDWTRVVEHHYGVGSELPIERGKSLFEHMIGAFLPPEVTIPAVEVYEAIYKE
jgi:hypothetical protein